MRDSEVLALVFAKACLLEEDVLHYHPLFVLGKHILQPQHLWELSLAHCAQLVGKDEVELAALCVPKCERALEIFELELLAVE